MNVQSLEESAGDQKALPGPQSKAPFGGWWPSLLPSLYSQGGICTPKPLVLHRKTEDVASSWILACPPLQ
jgi:hypothetical protein